MNKYYFHGSNFEIKGDYLMPHKSRVIDNEKAVFATNELWLALLFILNLGNDVASFGYYNNKPYILEFEFDLLKNKNTSGWIYVVNKQNFHNDKRLGLQGYEFINDYKVKIVKKIFVRDVLKELKKIKNIKIVLFEEMLKKILK